MTNREIKLELAKAALSTCRHMTSESLSKSIKNLYEWITEEPEKEVKEEAEPKTEYDNRPIDEVLKQIRLERRRGGRYATQLDKVFIANSIRTVGDLLRLGSSKFRCLDRVGKGSFSSADEALNILYGIYEW